MGLTTVMTAAIDCVASVESTESPMLDPTRGLTRISHAANAKPKSKSRMPGAVPFAKPGKHWKILAKRINTNGKRCAALASNKKSNQNNCAS
eukprot:9831686-Karenia_brevis.AAC.1